MRIVMQQSNEDQRRRQTSRLWYRRPIGTEPTGHDEVLQSAPMIEAAACAAAETTPRVDAELTVSGDDEYAYFELTVSGIKLRTLNFNAPELQHALHIVQPSAWRSYPAGVPALALSAIENLQTRLMGPTLSSGRRYRVVDCYNGVVAVEIQRSGLPPMRGYCLAADLEAAEQGARPKRSGLSMELLRSMSEEVSRGLGGMDFPPATARSTSHD
jgi:hypothetical protein